MKFSSTFFGALLTSGGAWDMSLGDHTFTATLKGEKPRRIPYESVYGVAIEPGTIWAEIIIDTAIERIRVDGIAKMPA